ncbi:MAG: ketopantoate reductase C-terminal domain-containing protein, partial [Verrucomicrobiota bacterium]|nr:ketopantoate reductase C-terminal domain-containing protein [Verrucomicrobiota bacterium]
FEGGLTARLQDVLGCFEAAGIKCGAVQDLMHAQWVKLVWNVPFNGLCIAEGGITTEDLLSCPEGEQQVRNLMREVVAGAAALGRRIAPEILDEQIRSTREMGAYRPSSVIDYLQGRDVEVEAIWEEPLWRAEQEGAELPFWRSLLGRIRRRLEERG